MYMRRNNVMRKIKMVNTGFLDCVAERGPWVTLKVLENQKIGPIILLELSYFLLRQYWQNSKKSFQVTEIKYFTEIQKNWNKMIQIWCILRKSLAS